MKLFSNALSYIYHFSKTCFYVMLFSAFVYTLLTCLSYFFAPFLTFSMFSALQSGDLNVLLNMFLINLALCIIYIFLCYLNNVYLDLNTYKLINGIQIHQLKSYHKMPLNNVNKTLNKGEVYNIIEQSSQAFATILSQATKLLINLLIFAMFAVSIYNLSGSLFILFLGVLVILLVSSYILKKVMDYSEAKKQKYLGEQEDYVNEMFSCLELRCFGDHILKFTQNRYNHNRAKIWSMTILQNFASTILEELINSVITLGKGLLLSLTYPAYLTGVISYELITAAISAFDNIKRIIVSFFDPIREILKDRLVLQNYYDSNDENEIFPERIETIEICDFTYEKEKVILDHIHLSFTTHNRIALIGTNGSGKTTLLKAVLNELSGITPVLYNGEHSTLENTLVRENFSYIPNLPQLFSGSVSENIAMNLDEGLQVSGNLDLEMNDVKAKQTEELSTGQKQRVNILRGIYNHGKFVIADEPDANIPLALGKRMMELIRENAQGYLIVTHNPQLIEYFDHVIFLDKGQKVFEGSVEDFVESVYYERWQVHNL